MTTTKKHQHHCFWWFFDRYRHHPRGWRFTPRWQVGYWYKPLPCRCCV